MSEISERAELKELILEVIKEAFPELFKHELDTHTKIRYFGKPGSDEQSKWKRWS